MNARRALVFAWIGLALPVSLPTQQPPQLHPGQRVRVTVPVAGLYLEEATVLTLSADSLVFERRWGAPRLAVVRDSVRILEVRRARSGIVCAGALGGAGVGVLVASLSCHGGSMPLSQVREHAMRCLFGLAGVPVLALVGWSIGNSVAGDPGWELVPLSSVRFGLAPLPDGRLGLGTSISF